MSFLEFQQPALSDEKAWLTLATLRHDDIQRAAGGWSRCLRDLVLHVFYSERSNAQVALALARPTILWMRLYVVMSDNDGIKLGLNTKGFAGTRPCPLCYNCWMRGFAPPGNHCDITTHDFARFVPLRPETLMEYVAALNAKLRGRLAGTCTQKELDDTEKAVGINADLRSFMFLALGNIEYATMLLRSLRFDWMHGFVSNGTLSEEVHRMLAKSMTVGITIERWRQVAICFLRSFVHRKLS